MKLSTISQVSKTFGVSTRMLRYYEQIGLLSSIKKEDYAYRVYDEDAVLRLQQIIVLRKLRIPLKQIAIIFERADTKTILDIFMQSIGEINDEITALSTMRMILKNFVDGMQVKSNISMKAMLLNDEIMVAAINSLSLTKISFREERSMNELNKANEMLSKLKNVRIVQLPPLTVASGHFIGENPEKTVGDMVSEFCKKINLYEAKPDSRMFGFNHPNPSPDKEHYGYEVWVTIPESMKIPAPMVKKHFAGGLYAVHTIKLGDFHEWNDLKRWVDENENYELNLAPEGDEIMGGCLEEHLNWVHDNHLGWPENFVGGQLDLYLPIRAKS